MTRGQATLLRAFSAWTVFVWVVFVRNILGDSAHSTGFKVVHTVIAIVSVAFAVAAWIVVRRLRRAGRAPVGVTAGGTTGAPPSAVATDAGSPASAVEAAPAGLSRTSGRG